MTHNKDPTEKTDLDRRLKITGLWEERKHIPADLRVTERQSEHDVYTAKESASAEQIANHYSMAAKDCIKVVCGHAFRLVDEAEANQYKGESVHTMVTGRLNRLRVSLPDKPMIGALLHYVIESRDFAELQERIASLRREVSELFTGKSSVLSALKEKEKEVKDTPPDAPGANKRKESVDL
jgi:hypothetical protein